MAKKSKKKVKKSKAKRRRPARKRPARKTLTRKTAKPPKKNMRAERDLEEGLRERFPAPIRWR